MPIGTDRIGRDRAHPAGPFPDTEERVDHLWYVVGFAFAGVSFVFLTIGAAWLSRTAHRATSTRACRTSRASTRTATPTAGSACRFYIYALLFVAFDIEVVFIYLWAIVFRDRARLGALS